VLELDSDIARDPTATEASPAEFADEPTAVENTPAAVARQFVLERTSVLARSPELQPAWAGPHVTNARRIDGMEKRATANLLLK